MEIDNTHGLKIWTIVASYILFSCVRLSEAQTQIGFEFNNTYTAISQDVGTFQRLLLTDIRERYNFTSSQLLPNKVLSGTDGRIQVNLTLNIDTSNTKLVQYRANLRHGLQTSDYAFVYIYDGLLYTIDNSTVSFVLSFWDQWHRYIPEIIIAAVCALAALAIFVSSIHLLCMNVKRNRRESYGPRNSIPMTPGPPHSAGRTNGGFFMEEIDGGQRVYTPKSSIGSTRFVYDRDTFYDKLIYGAYEVPPKHVYNFL